MKFGCTFTEYLQEEREWLMDENCAHIKYDRLKNVLKSCQNYKDSSSDDQHQSCDCQSCPGMSCVLRLYVYVCFLSSQE